MRSPGERPPDHLSVNRTGIGRTGFTTGTCAAAAAKAATMVLSGLPVPKVVVVRLPDGSEVELAVQYASGDSNEARAAVTKDAGDDPDVTDGCLVVATVRWAQGIGSDLAKCSCNATPPHPTLSREGRGFADPPPSTGGGRGRVVTSCDQTPYHAQVSAYGPQGNDVTISAGEGVGMVTKPGLALPPGEPAINPVPRMMIRAAVREITERPVKVTISVPGGEDLAQKTFNPRLGVVGGLSILGTSGIVRPFSAKALRDALKCAMSVAQACNVTAVVFVPGRIGERAARALFDLAPEQLIEVSNEWGFVLDEAARLDLEGLLVLGHPGKLAKLPQGDWDTHSSRSRNAVPAVMTLGKEVLGRELPESRTVEGLFSALPERDRGRLADALAETIAESVFHRVNQRFPVAVVLVNLSGEVLGSHGDLGLWRRMDVRSSL